MMARLETLTFLVVISSFIHTASSSAILNYFSSRESSQANVEDDLVPEVYGGALTEFFQTLSVVGEGESRDDNLQSEDDLENIPSVDIDVEEFLLITDQELKARPRSDKIEAAIASAVNLDKKSSDDMSPGSASSMNSEVELPVSTSLIRFSQTLQESREPSSTTTISTISEPSISTNSTEVNDVASDSSDSTSARVSTIQSNSTPTFSNQQTVSTLSIHSSSFESSLEVIDDVVTPTGRAFLPALETDQVAASDKFLLHKQPLEIDSEHSKLSLDSSASPITTVLPSLYSPSVDSITTEHSVKVNDSTTSFDDLLLALEKLDTLNEAVEDLHTSQDQSIQTDFNDHTIDVHDIEMQDVAQDRTDMVDNSDEDDSDGFFAFLYKWLA